MTMSSIISFLSAASAIFFSSGSGSTDLVLLCFVLWRRSSPAISGSVAIISTLTGVNMEPLVAPGTPMGTKT